MVRAWRSGPLPAVKPTSTRTGLAGYCWAWAWPCAEAEPSARPTSKSVRSIDAVLRPMKLFGLSSGRARISEYNLHRAAPDDPLTDCHGVASVTRSPHQHRRPPMKLLAVSLLAAAALLNPTGAFAQKMNSDDLKWVNKCIDDNKGGASPAIIRK